MSIHPTCCFLLARQDPDQVEWAVSEHLVELAELVHAAGMEPVGSRVLRRAAVDARTFYGKGQIEEAAREAKGSMATLLVCDDELTGGQVNAIQKTTGLRVLDRTGLILAIFEQRARSQEAKVQVELARCEYELPRLKGAWTHLERQVGGVGVRGGPGETQIEVDRRITRQRIAQLKKELKHLERVRETQRQGRIAGVPRVALVGYTNAGKTSILRALTGEGEPQDMLFATLDTTTRQLWLAEAERSVVLSDTVGFIRDLPHKLVEAFRATLLEAADADLLLHVVDAASPQAAEQMLEVERVLQEIGADRIPQILVFNKLDLVEPSARPRVTADRVERSPGVATPRVFVSARDGSGLDALRQLIAERLPEPLNGNALPTLAPEALSTSPHA